MKDGSVVSKDVSLTQEQKSNAAAIIIRPVDGETPALGMGAAGRSGCVYWSRNDSQGHGYTIESLIGTVDSGLMTGKGSYEKLK